MVSFDDFVRVPEVFLTHVLLPLTNGHESETLKALAATCRSMRVLTSVSEMRPFITLPLGDETQLARLSCWDLCHIRRVTVHIDLLFALDPTADWRMALCEAAASVSGSRRLIKNVVLKMSSSMPAVTCLSQLLSPFENATSVLVVPPSHSTSQHRLVCSTPVTLHTLIVYAAEWTVPFEFDISRLSCSRMFIDSKYALLGSGRVPELHIRYNRSDSTPLDLATHGLLFSPAVVTDRIVLHQDRGGLSIALCCRPAPCIIQVAGLNKRTLRACLSPESDEVLTMRVARPSQCLIIKERVHKVGSVLESLIRGTGSPYNYSLLSRYMSDLFLAVCPFPRSPTSAEVLKVVAFVARVCVRSARVFLPSPHPLPPYIRECIVASLRLLVVPWLHGDSTESESEASFDVLIASIK
jgi:hypothetical protein